MTPKAQSQAAKKDYVMVHREQLEKYGNKVALVYGLVERRCGGKPFGQCVESVPNMARYVQMGERTVKQALARLIEAGEIERIARPGQTSAYVMAQPTQVQIDPGPNEPGYPGPDEPETRAHFAPDPGPNGPANRVLRDSARDEVEDSRPRAADSLPSRSKAERLAKDHSVLKILTDLGISDGQARRLSMYFTEPEALAIADAARAQEPDDLGAYAARMFRDHLVEAADDDD